MTAGAFAVALIGSGRWSLDGLLGSTYSDQLAVIWGALMVAGVVIALILHMAAPKPQSS